jgi:hypothetical protein
LSSTGWRGSSSSGVAYLSILKNKSPSRLYTRKKQQKLNYHLQQATNSSFGTPLIKVLRSRVAFFISSNNFLAASFFASFLVPPEPITSQKTISVMKCFYLQDLIIEGIKIT